MPFSPCPENKLTLMGIVPGPDATDGPLHGRQEGRFPHGYHGHHRCLPLHVTCGGHVPCARLRPPDIDASHGALEGPARIVAVIRGAWPSVRITVRGNSGFRALYEDLHCARGDMENRIRERQPELFADRTPTATMRANRLRVYLPAFAGMPGRTVRAVGPAGTDPARAQPGTIRARLLKVACRLRVGVRRIRLSLSPVHPYRGLFRRAVAAPPLAAAARASPWPPRRPPEPPEPRAGEAGHGRAAPAAPQGVRGDADVRSMFQIPEPPSAAITAGRGRMTGRIGTGCPDSRSGEISGLDGGTVSGIARDLRHRGPDSSGAEPGQRDPAAAVYPCRNNDLGGGAQVRRTRDARRRTDSLLHSAAH